MKPKNIFVVGCFRSGTTILAAILDASDEISFIRCETKFVGGLVNRGLRYNMREVGDLSDDHIAGKLVETIYKDDSSVGCYGWLRSHVKQDYFLGMLLKSDRSDRSIFNIILKAHAYLYSDGKSIVGEKTPAHIYHVPTLLEWFPEAKIIHIIRDPRAVLASRLLQRKKGYEANKYAKFLQRYLKSFFVFIEVFHVTAAWLRAASLHFEYKKLYPLNYCFLRYEDLIIKPKETLQQLFGFLKVDFNYEPIKQKAKVINSSFTDGYVGNDGFDVKAIDRWKTYLKPWMRRWLNLSTKKYLEKFGYY